MYSLSLSNITGNQYQIAFNRFNFPGGESHIKINSDHRYDCAVIESTFQSNNDLINIALAKDALDRLDYKRVSLLLPYFPYARQDRVCVEGEPLSVKVAVNIINSCNFDKVIVLDPHSNVTPALLNNVRVIEMLIPTARQSVKFNKKYDCVICPDSGAFKRASYAAKALGIENIITFSKNRNLNTGQIIGLSYENKMSDDCMSSAKCIVIDDICDGGRTFVEIAKVLKNEYPKIQLDLYVSHGIFSSGFDELFKYYADIYTTNSLPQKTVEHLTVFPINVINSKKLANYYI